MENEFFIMYSSCFIFMRNVVSRQESRCVHTLKFRSLTRYWDFVQECSRLTLLTLACMPETPQSSDKGKPFCIFVIFIISPVWALASTLWGFLTVTFIRGWIVSPAPNPQPGGPGLRIYDPQGQGGPAIPPGTG
jgi:hypothetical protein